MLGTGSLLRVAVKEWSCSSYYSVHLQYKWQMSFCPLFWRCFYCSSFILFRCFPIWPLLLPSCPTEVVFISFWIKSSCAESDTGLGVGSPVTGLLGPILCSLSSVYFLLLYSGLKTTSLNEWFIIKTNKMLYLPYLSPFFATLSLRNSSDDTKLLLRLLPTLAKSGICWTITEVVKSSSLAAAPQQLCLLAFTVAKVVVVLFLHLVHAQKTFAYMY